MYNHVLQYSSFVYFNEFEVSPQSFGKKSQVSNFIKIRPVGAVLFHADGRTDGQTDMTKLLTRFSQFCERA